MQTKVHCPRCHTPLRVPESASGRPARCPACRRVFKVPDPEELFEETISTWIEEDLAVMERKQEKYWEQIGQSALFMRHIPPAEQGLAEGMAANDSSRVVVGEPGARIEISDDDVAASGDDDDIAIAMKASGASSEASPIEAGVDTSPVADEVQTVEVEDESDEARSPDTVGDEAPQVAAPIAAPEHKPRSAHASTERPPAILTDYKFTGDVTAAGNRPFLAVESCTTVGVVLCFDSHWLEHPRFAVSLPVRCAITGQTDRKKLRARPLSFVDQSQGAIRSASDLELKHQQKLLTGQTPADLLDIMGRMIGLPRPFNSPVPYYIDERHTNKSLRCWTKTRDETSVSCFIEIPDGRYALEWVGRVNGICGEEYAALQAQVNALQSDEWGELSEVCRSRIDSWCKFEAMEQFRMYLIDADFGRRDEGLAGLVVTNQRLIFCKYHHRGSVDLTKPGKLLIRPEANWAHLSWESDGTRIRIVKVHADSVAELAAELGELPHVAIEQTSETS